jgi:hypothetical protein
MSDGTYSFFRRDTNQPRKFSLTSSALALLWTLEIKPLFLLSRLLFSFLQGGPSKRKHIHTLTVDEV